MASFVFNSQLIPAEKNRAMGAKYRDIIDPDACPPTDTSLGPLPFHRPWKLHYGLNRSMLWRETGSQFLCQQIPVVAAYQTI
jgi:hypothetical protein